MDIPTFYWRFRWYNTSGNDTKGGIPTWHILPYGFVRSQELRGAAWEEIDLDAAEWIIPAGRMKMKKPHIDPLARQVVRLFTVLREHADSGLVLPEKVTIENPEYG